MNRVRLFCTAKMKSVASATILFSLVLCCVAARGPPRGRCVPGEWISSPLCHKCHCLPSGDIMCTPLPCIGGRTQESNSELNDESGEEYKEEFSQLGLRHYVFENKTHCTPGSDFYLGCNPCKCQSSGIKRGSSCDNKGCPPFPALYDVSAKCTPGTEFKHDCNICICGTKGTVRSSICTLMACNHSHP